MFKSVHWLQLRAIDFHNIRLRWLANSECHLIARQSSSQLQTFPASAFRFCHKFILFSKLNLRRKDRMCCWNQLTVQIFWRNFEYSSYTCPQVQLAEHLCHPKVPAAGQSLSLSQWQRYFASIPLHFLPFLQLWRDCCCFLFLLLRSTTPFSWDLDLQCFSILIGSFWAWIVRTLLIFFILRPSSVSYSIHQSLSCDLSLFVPNQDCLLVYFFSQVSVSSNKFAAPPLFLSRRCLLPVFSLTLSNLWFILEIPSVLSAPSVPLGK